MNIKFRHNILKHKYALLFFLILGSGCALFLLGNTHDDLWYDECYSAAIIKHTFSDICTITSGDSHPPLYYILLKIFTAVFGESVFTLRTFSAVGMLALAALGAFPVRRACGRATGVIYSILVITLPMLYSYAQEVRMYSWAAFFVAGSLLYGFLAVRDEKKTDFALFSLFTAAALYVHYYATMAVIIINALIFLFVIIKKRKMFAVFAISAGIAAISFLPWTFFMFHQVIRIKHSYWVPQVTWDVMFQVLTFPFNHKFSSEYVYLLPFYIICVGLIVFGIVAAFRKNQKNVILSLFSISVYILTILGGVVLSRLLRPILIPRYTLVLAGLLVLCTAFGISRIKSKKAIAIVMMIFLVFSIYQIRNISTDRYNGAVREAVQYMRQTLKPDDVIVYTEGTSFGTFCYYLPEYKHYFYQKPGDVWFSNYDAFKPAGDYGNELQKYISKKKYVYLISRTSGYLTEYKEKPKILIGAGGLSETKHFSLNHSWYAFNIQKVSADSLHTVN